MEVVVSSETEYEDRFEEKELLGEGGFGKVNSSWLWGVKSLVWYLPFSGSAISPWIQGVSSWVSKERGFICGKAAGYNEEEAERQCLGRDQPHQGPRQPLHHKVVEQHSDLVVFSIYLYLSRFVVAFEMEKGIVLVTELLQGGELFERSVGQKVALCRGH